MKNYHYLIVLAALVWPGVMNAAPIADSEADFTEEQGAGGWSYGFRVVDADDDRANYDSDEDFQLFSEEEGWVWTGTSWDWADGNVPWTTITAGGGHPNGTNNNEEQWAIRRWTANVASTTPIAIQWHLHKENTNGGNGTSVSVHLNGERIDFGAVEGDDGEGIDSVVYANVNPGDQIDIALTPEGPDEGTGDGNDGSAWTVVLDDEIPANPVQPDGSSFISDSGEDSDNDGLSDSWERAFFPDDLTRLAGDGDNDGDGLTDLQEFEKRTNPTNADTDEDGLMDGVETDTGAFVSITDTGTKPRTADSDGDGLLDGAEATSDPLTDPNEADTDGDSYSDGEEVSLGFDPTNAEDNPGNTVIANSIDDWNLDGEQGVNGWTNGYRNVTEDGKGTDYDPATDFIVFNEDDGWIWDGAKWDWGSGNVPWTEVGAEVTHPNGDNNGAIHWTIRRWDSSSLEDNVTPLALTWAIRKNNVNGGNGVAGSLHINGKQVDFEAIEGTDGEGVERTFYANVAKGDLIDIALTPEGPDGSNGDGADGSSFSLVINSSVPTEPRQPNGDLFVPATAEDSDGDGLPDPWELSFFEGDLTQLSGEGDLDGDGLNDRGEFDLNANPTNQDTDGDGLQDGVETGTLVFVSATDTGTNPTSVDTDQDGIADGDELTGNPSTNPTKVDTDDDGFSDSEEITNGTDPNDAADNPFVGVIASSEDDWSTSGEHGVNGWIHGYRNLSAENDDVDQVDYDPNTHFIQYPDNWWNGTTWDFPDGNVPWTFHSPTTTHPNGDNNETVHWSIRRWVASVEDPTAISITWTTAKDNTNGGNGVTGGVHLNGVRLDAVAIEGNDGEGVERIVYANVEPGDFVDLINSPQGPDESNNDGSDGSLNSMIIGTVIPDNPTQPDGTPFEPVILGNPSLSFKRASPFGQLGENPGAQTRMVTLKNAGGTQDLVVSAASITGTNASNFTTDLVAPLTLAPDETIEITITFDPQGSDGGFIAGLDFTSNDENRPNRSLDLSASIPDANKLIAWYRLDDTEGTQMLDSSGNGNHGAYMANGGASIAYGEAGLAGGTAVRFTPSGADAAFGNIDRFGAQESLTLSLWAQLDAAQGEVAGLISKGTETGNPFALAMADNKLLWFSSGAEDISGTTDLPTDSAVHIVVTYDVSGADAVTTLYIDGVETDQNSQASEYVDADTVLQFGAVTGQFGFNGVLDDIQIYGRALSAAEVTTLKDNPGEKLGGSGDGGGDPPPADGIRDLLTDVTKSADGLSIGIGTAGTYDVEYSETLENDTWEVIASGVSGARYQDTDAVRLGKASGYYRFIEP